MSIVHSRDLQGYYSGFTGATLRGGEGGCRHIESRDTLLHGKVLSRGAALERGGGPRNVSGTGCPRTQTRPRVPAGIHVYDRAVPILWFTCGTFSADDVFLPGREYKLPPVISVSHLFLLSFHEWMKDLETLKVAKLVHLPA